MSAAGAAPIFVLNCGSSSIKFALFDAGSTQLPRTPLWNGKLDDVAGAYPAALQQIREGLSAHLGGRRLAAVVHRVVHGGARYVAPVRVDAGVLADLKAYVPLAPLHQPFALEAIDRLLASDPELPQIACFDTAFHHTMPQVEQMTGLPYAAFQRGLRRYGFHGLSYEYMSIVLPERYGDRARGRCIVAHLGSGASLCAMRHLESVATTMGFSALDGLLMGTRCGALDPGALLYLMEIEKLSAAEVADLLYHQSGLLGVSGVSSDPRVLLPREAGDERVQAALALYVRRIVREIGALTAVLGGVDLLVFTAGIGEHNAVIRERVCRGLGFLGVKLDDAANAGGAALISGPDSNVAVAVERTNEEWIAAVNACRLLRG